MLGKEFRGLAETVTRTYGNDPWFFLRELAQNSRDAGAHNIWVSAATTPQGLETLTFADDGRGMTLTHARRFLFRLYASDKTTDHKAAGKYGIGFWTILGFRPDLIRLQSRCGKNAWALELDGELAARPAACLLNRSGTTISLSRPAAFPSPAEFIQRLESELREYCQYLRRNDRKAGMLPVWFAGQNITRPMTLPGPLSCRFRSGAVEGAVGLAEKPHVRLYARGLPVWQGAILNQMSHLQMDTDGTAEIGCGLAPEFLLNGNHLDVTFSRSLALENKALATVRKKAEAALRRLLETSLERTFPRTWRQRSRDRLLAACRLILRPGWHWLALLLLIVVPLEITVLRRWFPAGRPDRSYLFSVQSGTLSYGGATVSLSTAAGVPPFSYQPKVPAWFRLFAADEYDIQSGFVRRSGRSRSGRDRLPAAPTSSCLPEQAWRMRLQAEAGGDIFLPLPPGHAILAGSVRLDGRPIAAVFSSDQGETIAAPDGGGLVEYLSCPGERGRELTAAEISHLTFLAPGLAMTPAIEKTVSEALAHGIAERVARARALVRDLVSYDTSPATARQYLRRSGGQPWLVNVLRTGKGDCDIINGLNVLILRKMGIPSRLVIGLIGERGRARPLLHAWSEYFDRGWMVIDASAGQPAGPQVRPAENPAVPAPDPALPAAAARSTVHLIVKRMLWPAMALLFMAAASAFLFAKRKKRVAEVSLPPEAQMKSQLMQLVQQAMLQPEIWGPDNPLCGHRILPTIGKKSLSIRQAQRLIEKKKLFFTANRNPLALAMMDSGIEVLDLSQPLYAPLRALLAGAIDADMLCRLRPVPAALRGPDSAYGLLDAVNACQIGTMKKPAPCLLAPGLSGSDLLTIALPAPLRQAPFFFPRCFVAVNPAGAVFQHLSSLYNRNPALAVFKFLVRLRSGRLPRAAASPAPLKKAARRLLRACT